MECLSFNYASFQIMPLNEKDLFSRMPDDMIFEIFSYCPSTDFKLISKKFYRITQQERFYQVFINYIYHRISKQFQKETKALLRKHEPKKTLVYLFKRQIQELKQLYQQITISHFTGERFSHYENYLDDKNFIYFIANYFDWRIPFNSTIFKPLASYFKQQEQQQPTTIEIRTGLEKLKGKCEKIISMRLSHATFTRIPYGIHYFRNLKVLNISHNLLIELPLIVKKLTHLELADFSFNRITYVFPEIASLPKLKKLLLSNNLITSFPSEIYQLNPELDIDISNNPINFKNFKRKITSKR